MTKIFVAAGSYPQYQDFINELPTPNHVFKYLHTTLQLYGTENPIVIVTGTWYENPDLADLRQHVYA